VGPFIFVNIWLAGFFAFAALHYAGQWWLSRRETSLLVFSIHCVLCAVLSAAIIGVATATTVDRINAALDWRTIAGALGTATTVWLVSRLTGVRAKWYVTAIIVMAVLGVAFNVLIAPVNGTALGIGRLMTPWGEELSFPVREPAGWWLAPLYGVVLSVDAFGLLASARLWTRDRIGGILIGLASAGGLSAGIIAMLADVQRAPMPYMGDAPYAFWVAVMSLMLSREYAQRYRTLVEYAPEAIVVLDATKQAFIDVNQNACRLFGLSREELLQRGPLDLSPVLQPYERFSSEMRQQMIDKALAGKTTRFEWMHQDAARRDIPCEVSLVRLPSTTQKLIRGSIIDITERKRAEGLLRKKDEELRRLVDSNVVGIVFWESNGVLTDANDYFLNLIGYSRAEYARGNIHWDNITPPEYLPLHNRAQTEMERSGVCVPFEKEYIRKDGKRVPVLVGRALFEGETKRGVAFVLDLTQRKRLEIQVRQAQKMEAIGHLAGGVAHDFNNILTVINGRCELLMHQCRVEPSVLQSLEEIHAAGIRAAALTRQLLAFSRQQMLVPSVLSINTVVTDTEKMLLRLIGEDIILTTQLDPNLQSVKADRSQLEQVLLNLSLNARDAMPRGGALTIETRNVVLDDAYCRAYPDLQPGSYSLLTVSDTGTGMDEKIETQIFQPFFTTKGPGKGTGLGLATVHGIVKQSGGHIEVNSQVGVGTTFKVFLPQIDEPPPVHLSQPDHVEMRHDTATILLAEDDAGVRSVVQNILLGEGYTVLIATNGLEALKIAESHPEINLLISDVVMPLLGGRALAERFTAIRPACKVLFLSGYTDDAVFRHGVRAEEFAFLQKPFSPEMLTQMVRKVLDDKTASAAKA
jgi:two-component system cell cycle sensor histidine kinase/response regulator CckA